MLASLSRATPPFNHLDSIRGIPMDTIALSSGVSVRPNGPLVQTHWSLIPLYSFIASHAAKSYYSMALIGEFQLIQGVY
jgi:hypothetical protein